MPLREQILAIPRTHFWSLKSKKPFSEYYYKYYYGCIGDVQIRLGGGIMYDMHKNVPILLRITDSKKFRIERLKTKKEAEEYFELSSKIPIDVIKKIKFQLEDNCSLNLNLIS